jgi:hypothetical protein
MQMGRLRLTQLIQQKPTIQSYTIGWCQLLASSTPSTCISCLVHFCVNINGLALNHHWQIGYHHIHFPTILPTARSIILLFIPKPGNTGCTSISRVGKKLKDTMHDVEELLFQLFQEESGSQVVSSDSK